ncbi:hypothetical protein K7G98_29650, partial [Saccharothrix sp. MB29]|nr:hypothetical protein [Saccharothrix sp. MB29]
PRPTPTTPPRPARGGGGANTPPTPDGIDEADASLKPRNLWLVENRMRALESSNDPAAVWTDPSAVVPAPGGTAPRINHRPPRVSDTGTTDAGTTSADTSADRDVQAPNAPLRRSRPAPTPAVPLVAITPPAPQPVFASVDLPDFFQNNQALGSVAVNACAARHQVTSAVNDLRPPRTG